MIQFDQLIRTQQVRIMLELTHLYVHGVQIHLRRLRNPEQYDCQMWWDDTLIAHQVRDQKNDCLAHAIMVARDYLESK